MAKLNLSGQRYGRLVAIKVSGKTKRGITIWLCQCDCGNTKEVDIGHLRSGDTRSCGCLAREVTKNRMISHGESVGGKRSTEYYAWRSMQSRCYNKKYYLYHRYGGRGIKVCKRWLDSFDNFLADMGRKPHKNLSLDRYPNPDGNYEPSNCRWATSRQQGNNKSGNKFLTYKNEKHTQAEWARKIGIDVKRLHALLQRNSFKSVMDHYEEHGIIDRRKAPFNKTFYKNPARAMLGITGRLHHASKPIIQIDKKTGSIIKKHESIRQAKLETGINNIDKALVDNTKSAGGFKWKYA